METWEAKMQRRLDETRSVRERVQSKFEIYGYPTEELSTFVFDMSEFYGACLKFLDQVTELLEEPDRDPDLVAVELGTLDAAVQDAMHHLSDLSNSLPRFRVFVSDLGEESGTSQPSDGRDAGG